MKLNLKYLHKQWNLNFKKRLEWKSCIPAPNTDILEVTTVTELSKNWKDFDYQQTSASAIFFFQDTENPKFNPKLPVMQILYLLFKKKQTQTPQTKTPSNFWLSVDYI